MAGADEPEFKTFIATGYEIRSIPVEYVIEAEDAQEALDKALIGSTESERQTGLGEVQDRAFDAMGIQETQEIPVESGAPDYDARLEAAVGVAVSGIELLDRVTSAVPAAGRPGVVRVTTETGSFLVMIRLENFTTDPDLD